MSSSSLAFYLLFAALCSACFFMSRKMRKWSLLAVNLLFLFSTNSTIALVFIAIALVNFYFPFSITKFKNVKNGLLVFLNLLFLVLFKYLFPNLEEASPFFYVLPVGISFFVFQQISYIVDRNDQVEFSSMTLRDYLTYSFFFLSFATGPLTRISEFYKDKRSQLYFSKENIFKGCLLIYLGVFKKFVIGDNIFSLTYPLFNRDATVPNADTFIPFLLSKYEVYANFSGFTDMAIGMALIIGFKLPQNFNRPFATRSITEFWKRWHMTLSRWIRDYLFYPLTVSKVGSAGTYFILAITFLVFAIWHDLKWTYVVYGLLQVLLIFFASLTREFTSKLEASFKTSWGLMLFKTFDWLLFYCLVLSVPGLLFRSNSLDDFTQIISSLLDIRVAGIVDYVLVYSKSLIPIAIGIILYELYEMRMGLEKLTQFFMRQNYFKRVGLFYLALIVLFFLYSKTSSSNFIYSIY